MNINIGDSNPAIGLQIGQVFWGKIYHHVVLLSVCRNYTVQASSSSSLCVFETFQERESKFFSFLLFFFVIIQFYQSYGEIAKSL